MLRKACRQISFETPDNNTPEGVFRFDVPVPDVPAQGALVKVICAGVCYRRRTSAELNTPPPSPSIKGIRDTALFPGYEVAGFVDQLGPDVPTELQLGIGDRVVVYPYEDLPSANEGYADYISVPDARYLVKVPEKVPMHVAAMLPSGALWAVNAVQSVLNLMERFVADKRRCNVLVVGTGGLALWTIRIAKHYLANKMNQVKVTIAALQDDALGIAEELEKWNVISWSEDVYESYLIDRTKNACGGLVDIALDFGATYRSLGRIMKCIQPNGVILVGAECHESLSRKMKANFPETQVELRPISLGNLDQLRELIYMVAEGKILAPPCNIFPVDNACDALQSLSQSTIKGRAVLQFEHVE